MKAFFSTLMFIGGLIFFMAGFGYLINGVAILNGIYSARSWVEVSAQITSFPASTLKKGQSLLNGLSYRYQWEGQTYYSRKATISGRNHSSAALKLRTELINLRNVQPLMPCYVNPKNPSEAILRRNTWEELPVENGFVALGHGTGGLALLLITLRKIRAHFAQSRACKTYPGQPWRWRPDWNQGLVKQDTFSMTWQGLNGEETYTSYIHNPLIIRWLMIWAAFVWNCLSWGSAYLVLTEPGTAIRKVAVLGVVAAGLAPIYMAWKAWNIHIACNQLTLRIPEGGLELGKPIKAVLSIPLAASVRIDSKSRLSVQCIAIREQKHRRYLIQKVLWSGKDAVKIIGATQSVANPQELALELDLPASFPLTSGLDQREEGIYWELNLLPASGKGRSLASFALPVFHLAKPPQV